jgi:hypothetical protein
MKAPGGYASGAGTDTDYDFFVSLFIGHQSHTKNNDC